MRSIRDIFFAFTVVVRAFQIGGPETNDHSFMLDHSDHLESLTSMFRELSGRKITDETKTIVAAIVDGINGNTSTGLFADHAVAQKLMDDALGEITACHDNRTIAFAGPIAGMEAEVNAARQAHAQCRANETARCQHQNQTCKTLNETVETFWYCSDVFTEGSVQGDGGTVPDHATCAHQPDEDASPSKRTVDVPYTYYHCNVDMVNRFKEVYVQQRDICDNATQELDDNRENCNNLQDDFETKYCSWNRARSRACSEYAECWENLGDDFAGTLAAVQAMEKQMKTQMNGLEIVVCMAGLILNNAQISIDDINGCSNLDCQDCNKLSIDYGAPLGLPEDAKNRTDCVVDPTDKPCTSSWVSSEYSVYNSEACNIMETCKECSSNASSLPDSD